MTVTSIDNEEVTWYIDLLAIRLEAKVCAPDPDTSLH